MNNKSCALFLLGKKEYSPDDFVGEVACIECACEDEALKLMRDKSIDYNGKSEIHFPDGRIKYFTDYGVECDIAWRSLSKYHR